MSFLNLIHDYKSKSKNDSSQITLANTTNSTIASSGRKATLEQSSFDEGNFIYATPMVKKEQFIPTTPKKEKQLSKYEKINIKGRNLTSLFDSM